jgi:hypothetical protein
MQALRTRHQHPLFRSGDLTEKSAREPRDPKREIDRVSDSAKPDADDRLDSWKEIASHLKRTVRTVQRWERQEGLPVRRHLHQRTNSVYACKSELDEWWSHEVNSVETKALKIFPEESLRELTDPQVFTTTRSEAGYQDANPAPPQYFVECVLKEVEICSSEDRTGRVVAVLRVPCVVFRLVLYISGWRKSSRLLPTRWCSDA